MKLKLKEEPAEWLKFTAVMALMLALVAGLLLRRKLIAREVFGGVVVVLLLALLAGWIRPRLVRGLYRGGMTVSFHFGQVMGKVLLTILFLVVVTPLGLLLRLMGKDLLRLKRRRDVTTYWQPAKSNKQFDRQF
jgi:hypothetical protein